MKSFLKFLGFVTLLNGVVTALYMRKPEFRAQLAELDARTK